ncbi:hypothetical protein M3204_14190 [Mesobacillus subterraneus]|uniref:YqgU-like beta propeller domain-containing protein n=1 Tax=Mesobacillus subterraneus TaxID=285983 RepID=UPI00203B5320|nr:hypothetical protein [Mesobacillus subterraneus]MCM3665562.1 hypothetical protein [Mesobacillus subterraneus]MCM3686257.1 hypothetical protein [Mesobacillus subterraneus]
MERKENTYRATFLMSLFFILSTSAFLLTGCSPKPDGAYHGGAKHSLNRVKETPSPSFLGAEIIPIQSDGEEFYKAAGWLNDSSILYIANKGEGSLLYSYNLATGKSTLLFESEVPIISAEASPGKKMVMIHSAVSNEGILTIIDPRGKKLHSTNIDSYELNFEWNPFNEELILISAFTEEWDFSSYLWNLRENDLQEINLSEPFVRWISKEELVYQKWDEEGIALQAPLYSVSLNDNQPAEIEDDVFQFDSLSGYLLTVKIDEQANPQTAQYTVYGKGINPAASFDAPVLTSFSGWVVPFYDLMEEGQDFLYLRALHNGEADIYQEGFDLIRFNLGSKTEDLIFSGLANEPISCSPSSKMCLYGFQLEKVLNIDTKEIIELVQ